MKKIMLVLTFFIFLTTELLGQMQFNVLVFTKTDGYRHESILQGVPAIKKLAEKHQFGVFWTEDAGVFSDSTLKEYDVILFLNNDGNVLNPSQQQAFKNHIERGNGFVGIHGASATELEWDWYGQLVGRWFIKHPKVQTARLNRLNSTFPGMSGFPEHMLWTDEWYVFTEEKSPNLNYLLSVDESTFDTKRGWKTGEDHSMGDFHPIAWYHKVHGGRSFYTGLGHIGVAFQSEIFLQHIYGGIFWAATGIGLQ
ncbi:MAG: ThuA domain-containing protein [candidate division KSB1 bacterium]|nr:ThuA domain-containing protein [candidate division KSB1 bacterium]